MALLPGEKELKSKIINSTEEKIIGYTNDGEPVFEKQITGIVTMDTSKNKTVFLIDSNIKDLICVDGWIYSDNVCRQKIGGYANNSSFSSFQWNESSKELSMWSATVFNNKKYIITMKYTKN